MYKKDQSEYGKKRKMNKHVTDYSLKKSFHDPVHGHIELHPLLVKIIDTPQFQRLRKIKQLGGTYFVYPGASHNRFEHSIGTCHLAGKLLRHIAQQTDLHRSLIPTEKDILCVEIAGLCHDLGHGPFSHVFDTQFMNKLAQNTSGQEKRPQHEDLSIKLLQHINEHMLKDDFGKAGIEKKEMEFICRLIVPQGNTKNKNPSEEEQRRAYMLEIISNKNSGVDVDKWDYFARDCHHLGISNTFDHNRFISLMKVLKYPQDNEYHLCVRDKESKNLYEMFHTRDALHRRAYQHSVTKAVEEMICDALLKANKHIKFQGKEKKWTISDTIYDMHAYQQLNDSVIELIFYAASMDPSNKDLEESCKLLKRIMKRDLYTLVSSKSILPKRESSYKKKNLEELMKNLIKKEDSSFDETKCFVYKNGVANKSRSYPARTPQEKVFTLKYAVPPDADPTAYLRGCWYCGEVPTPVVAKFDYGLKENNPVNQYLFYSKDLNENPRKMTPEEVSHMLPQNFLEYKIYVYSKIKEDAEKLKEICEGKSPGCFAKLDTKLDQM